MIRFSWSENAACKGHSPMLFYGPYGESAADRETREAAAKQICSRCPVAHRCLSYAMKDEDASGVWGGTNAHERAAKRRGGGMAK